MKPYRIKAKFKGEDGSVGYKNGRSYNLLVLEPTLIDRMLNLYSGNPSWIVIKTPFFVPYSNWTAFYHNWEKVQ